jgi:hypothetical protein
VNKFEDDMTHFLKHQHGAFRVAPSLKQSGHLLDLSSSAEKTPLEHAASFIYHLNQHALKPEPLSGIRTIPSTTETVPLQLNTRNTRNISQLQNHHFPAKP